MSEPHDTLFGHEDRDRKAANPSRWQAAKQVSPDLFSGATYSRQHDEVRLTGQLRDVFNCLSNGSWKTLREIQREIGHGSEAGLSARIRDLRKEQHGRNVVERRRRGDPADGIHEYRLVVNQARRFTLEGCNSSNA